MTIFDGNGFINKAKVTIHMEVKGNEFDTATIGQVAKHELCHGIGLVTQTSMVSSSRQKGSMTGMENISKCDLCDNHR